MSKYYVVHYAEIALKGRNKPFYIDTLRKNLEFALSDVEGVSVKKLEGRLLVEVKGDTNIESRIQKVFGVAWFTEVVPVELELQRMSEVATKLVLDSDCKERKTFGVSARRAQKSFPYNSMQIASIIGEHIVKNTDYRVDLTNPCVRVYVDIVNGMALLYTQKKKGPGGLPVGVSGRVVHLFSGGIDSPVAAWLLMKRGCEPIYLHFYALPSAELVLQSKVGKIIKVLSSYSPSTVKLVLVPFADYELLTSKQRTHEPVMFRLFMRVVAEEVAKKFYALGISTGDNLGQVASQTLPNIAAMDEGSSLPVLRPLLTYDKQEIIDLAKEIGTYEFSIEKYKDCCSIIATRPEIRVEVGEVNQEFERLGLKQLAAKVLERASVATYDASRGAFELAKFGEYTERKVEGLKAF